MVQNFHFYDTFYDTVFCTNFAEVQYIPHFLVRVPAKTSKKTSKTGKCAKRKKSYPSQPFALSTSATRRYGFGFMRRRVP